MMKIAVIGGGASGLMAASVASQKHKVTVFESQSRVGKKLFVSGNGKCNMTNNILTRKNLQQPNDFYNCQQACDVVSAFDYDDFMLFCKNTLGIETIVDSHGRVYPRSENASSVLDAFRLKCQKNGVKIFDEKHIIKIEKSGKLFKVFFDDGFAFFDKVIFCVGSAIQSRTFSSMSMLKELGIESTRLQASLTPVKTKKVWLQLNGIKAKCDVILKKSGKVVAKEYGEVLFRDYGLSGIVIFNMSAYIARDIVRGENAKYQICLDLFPEFTYEQLVEKLNDRLLVCGDESKTFFVGLLCNKLAEVVIKQCKTEEKIGKKDINSIVSFLKNMQFEVSDLCGVDKGQVVSGGIKFAEIDKNMQSIKVPGLYFAGECIDADGLCGGFNLQFAFSSGYIAGKNV